MEAPEEQYLAYFGLTMMILAAAVIIGALVKLLQERQGERKVTQDVELPDPATKKLPVFGLSGHNTR